MAPAFSKGRGNKRPSSTSYTSTVTTLVFVALCVFGVWMVASNSMVSSPKRATITTHTAIDNTEEELLESVTNTNNNNNDNSDESSDQTVNNNQDDSSDGITKSEESESNENGSSDNNNSDDGALLSSTQSEALSESNENGSSDNDNNNQIKASQKDEENQEQTMESQNNNVDSGGGESQEQSSLGNDEQENEKQLREDKGENDDSAEEAEKKRKKASKKEEAKGDDDNNNDLEWHLCNVTAGFDFIPCLDNEKYLKYSHRKHYEHRERHCPEDAPTCLVPLPNGYKEHIPWPSSRDKIWYHNIPHTKLAEVKGHQNWVKLTGEFLTFPGGGTQFIHGALHYIDFLQKAEAGIGWGKHTRVILDVGCGVGSFGGYLFERDVIAMSFAPKDEHEAQVQFALERGIPALSAVMGTQRLQFPGRVFDLVHCARCRVPWHEDGGLLLLELNRVLRPGGFFVWSATPVYQTLKEDVEIWKQMSALTKAMCWELVTIKNDTLNQVGAAFFRKPVSNECYEQREENEPPMCKDDDDPNAAWYVPLQACLHKLPGEKSERGAEWPEAWPERLHKAPYWLSDSQVGIFGKPLPQDFVEEDQRWKDVIDELSNNGVSWSNIRNVMDMRAVYGGFAAALRDLQLWVFNVVNIDSPDTLPIIYERGLIGIYHDWCESFSTYPRTYDLLHADQLFSKLKNRYPFMCKLAPVIVEVDRIVRPGGSLVVRDESNAISEVESLLKSLHWEVTLSKDQEGVLFAKKGYWRPTSFVSLF
ncbi:probable methyltransferase PMT27 [Arachis duranensis]|uniref:Probable methyltransferase PMT27 n=1 Tax=Arachis duranensis TaxID=130453 RepID=A0A9C6TT45_ARADU|nr:probable methyltransferase PMT27 [Arachis duranensis]